MVKGEGRAITPIRPIAGYVTVVAVEGWMMIQGKAIGEGKSDRGLLGPGLASAIVGLDGSPIVGGVVGPVDGWFGRIGDVECWVAAIAAGFLTFEMAWGEMASLASGMICAAKDGRHCDGGDEEQLK